MCSGNGIKVSEKFRTNIGVGITGASGPRKHDGEPAGTVWVGISIDDNAPLTYRLQLSGITKYKSITSSEVYIYYLMRELVKARI